MKTKLLLLSQLGFVIAFVCIIMGVSGAQTVSAASSCNSEYCRIDPSDTLTIDQWGTCYDVSNYPPNIPIYVPVRTAPEWVYFYNNLPGNVTKTSCPPPGNNTGAYTGTYTGSYQSGYTSTSGYTGTYTGTYVDTYTGSYTGAYTPVVSTYVDTYTGTYTGTYVDTYTGTYTGTYVDTYTGTYTGTYTDTYTGTYTDTYTDTYTGTYTDTYTPPESGYTSGYSTVSSYVPEDDGDGCSGTISIDCYPDPDTCVTVDNTNQYYTIYTYSPNGFTPDGSGGGTFDCGGTCDITCSP